MADLFDKLKDQVANVGTAYELREPCRYCNEPRRGRLITVGNQDTVRCLNCGEHLYNAPRTETGREVRTVSTVRHVPASQHRRICERAHGRCELCGSREQIEVAHIISLKDGLNALKGILTDAQLNSDANLMALCKQCNVGERSFEPWIYAALVYLRTTKPS